MHWKKQKISRLMKVQKEAQFTCQSDTVGDGSLRPNVASLVCPSGTVHSIVDCHEFIMSQT